MFTKVSYFAAIAVLAALGAEDLAWGQSPPLPTPQFRPLTETDVQESLAQIKAAATALDARFSTAGDSANGWKEYLGWDQFRAELAKPRPDNGALFEVYKKLSAGYEGLELKWFADLRTALRGYFFAAGGVGNRDLVKTFQGEVDALDKEIKALSGHPTTAEMRKIDDHLYWLENARQAPELVQAVRARFSQPNFRTAIGGDLIGMGVGGPIDDVAPIQDCILGTAINGTGRTVGQTTTALAADPNFARFDAISDATNYSNNVGRNGPVCIYSTGRTWLGSDKRLWLDEAGVHALPAATAADAQTTITNIVSVKGRRLVEQIAWRRADKQLGEAEAIASQHAAGRFAARVDAQAEPAIEQANEQYAVKIRGPLEDRRAFPRSLGFATGASALQISGLAARPSQLAAPTPPPDLAQPADIALYVHESTINNFAETVFTGMRLNDAMVRHTATDLLGRLPDQLKSDQEPFTVVFAPDGERTPPLTVSIGDNELTVTLRGKEYIANDRTQPGMNVTAVYKFVKTPEGYKAVRQGDLQIYGFGQVPGTPRSLRQQGIYTVLQRKFGKLFASEVKLQGFSFNGKLAAAGRIVPREIIARDGWLAIGYRREGAAAPAVTVAQAAKQR